MLLVLAGCWAVAAWSLWQSRVPGDLDLPDVGLGGIDPSIVDRAERYELFFRIEFVLSQAVLIAVLLAYAKWGVRFARESAAGRIGTGMLLGMIGLALVWISQVPFRLAEVWWNRRYDQTDSGYVETLFANWFELGAEFLFICFALVIVMAIAGRFPRRWWLGAAPVFVALGALFAFVFPYLSVTESTRPPRPRGRRARVREGSRASSRCAVRVEDVTDFTNTPNAYAVGFGPTKRIVFWNTLLDGRFATGEIRVVLAHELGHHSRNHIPEGLAWYALFAFPGAWLIAVATRRRGGMATPSCGAALAARPRRAQPALDARLQPDLAPHGGRGGLGRARDDARPRLGEGALPALHDRVAERPRPADVVLRALRQPPVRREADRPLGRGLATPASR